MIPTSIDGTDITGATIDGTDVTEITVDGDTVFTAGPAPGNFQYDAPDLNLSNNQAVLTWAETSSNDTLSNGSNLTFDTTTMNDVSVNGQFGLIESTSSGLQNLLFNETDISISFSFVMTTATDNDRLMGFDDGNTRFYIITQDNFGGSVGNLRLEIADRTTNERVCRFDTNTTFNDGNAHFAVATISGGFASGMSWYVDDMTTDIGSDSANDGISRLNQSTGPGFGFFGEFGSGSGLPNMNLGFIRFDNKVLTQQERQDIKNSRPEL